MWHEKEDGAPKPAVALLEFDPRGFVRRDRKRWDRLLPEHVRAVRPRELEISYAYISRIEANQRRPSVKALRLLAPKLGVSVHWLETGRPDPAEELARLVLDHKGMPLPTRATTIAKQLLRDRAGKI